MSGSYVRVAVSVKVRSYQAARPGSGGDGGLDREGAVAVAKHNRNIIRRTVGDGQVRNPVLIPIAGSEPHRISPYRHLACLQEGAVPIALPDAHGIIIRMADRQVHDAVLIEIPDRDSSRIIDVVHVLLRLKGAVSVPKKNGQHVPLRVQNQHVRMPVSVHIPDGRPIRGLVKDRRQIPIQNLRLRHAMRRGTGERRRGQRDRERPLRPSACSVSHLALSHYPNEVSTIISADPTKKVPLPGDAGLLSVR